jgi:hypothetical protein
LQHISRERKFWEVQGFVETSMHANNSRFECFGLLDCRPKNVNEAGAHKWA